MIPHCMPDPSVLGALGQAGGRHRLPGQIGGGGEGARGRDLQRRGRREAGADRDLAREHAVPPAQRGAGFLEGPGRALDVFDPALAAVERAQLELLLVREVERAEHDPVVGARAQRDPGPEVQGHGEDEPFVVVGVLAEQVDAPRRVGDEAWARRRTARGRRGRRALPRPGRSARDFRRRVVRRHGRASARSGARSAGTGAGSTPVMRCATASSLASARVSAPDDAPGAQHDDARRQGEQLRHLARDQEDGAPVRGQPVDEGVDLRLGADVHAARRLVQDEDPALRGQPAREHDLLLVAARQAHAPGNRCAGCARAARANCCCDQRLLPPALHPGEAGQAVEDGQRRVGAAAQEEHETLALPVLGHEAEADAQRGRRGCAA